MEDLGAKTSWESCQDAPTSPSGAFFRKQSHVEIPEASRCNGQSENVKIKGGNEESSRCCVVFLPMCFSHS